MSILKTIRTALRLAGVELHRANPAQMPLYRLERYLAEHGVACVLDIGANRGDYAQDVLSAGFGGKVVSFEPLPEEWKVLAQRAERWSGRWIVPSPVAITNSIGEASFVVAGNSVSSSLLDMTNHHVEAAPESAPVRNIKVRASTIDQMVVELDLKGPIFLKMDVQGAEMLVLQGAERSIESEIVGVQVEMSLVPLYEGQGSAVDVDRFLRDSGFECWDVIPVFREPKNHRLLQYDGIYFRRQA